VSPERDAARKVMRVYACDLRLARHLLEAS
jgi:hypothetical protein